MRDIVFYGSEVSLHFETLANYVKKRKITKKEEITKEMIKEMQIRLKKEIKRFEEILNSKIYTIASHGAPENRFIGTPNNILTENRNYKFFDILLEAYDKNFIKEIDVYISDTAIEYNNGWRYGIHPLEAINKDYKKILILTHPSHWCVNLRQKFKKMVKLVIFGEIQKKEIFKRT